GTAAESPTATHAIQSSPNATVWKPSIASASIRAIPPAVAAVAAHGCVADERATVQGELRPVRINRAAHPRAAAAATAARRCLGTALAVPTANDVVDENAVGAEQRATGETADGPAEGLEGHTVRDDAILQHGAPVVAQRRAVVRRKGVDQADAAQLVRIPAGESEDAVGAGAVDGEVIRAGPGHGGTRYDCRQRRRELNHARDREGDGARTTRGVHALDGVAQRAQAGVGK